jgi:putative hydrolase of the HAD superfamily
MTERPVRGVCVDLDDTLFPQQEWLDGAWLAVADRAATLGLDGAALHSVVVRIAAEGSDRGGIIDRALVALGVQPGPYVASLVSAFSGHAPDHLTPYPAVLTALDHLQTMVPVVLITDGNPRIQRAKIAALRLESRLDHVVISDEIGGRAARKPNAAPFLRALQLLGMPPVDVVHVGDRPAKDVAGAQAVGMRCLRVRTGEYADTPDPAGLVPWQATDSFPAAVELLLPLLEMPGPVSREHGEAISRL